MVATITGCWTGSQLSGAGYGRACSRCRGRALTAVLACSRPAPTSGRTGGTGRGGEGAGRRPAVWRAAAAATRPAGHAVEVHKRGIHLLVQHRPAAI